MKLHDALAELLYAFTRLFKLKTIITLGVMAAMLWGYFTGRLANEMFLPIVTMVLTHYFRKGKEE